MAIQDINKQEVAQVSGGILGSLNLGGLLGGGTTGGLLGGLNLGGLLGSVTGLLKPVTDVLTGLPVVGGLLGGVLSAVTGLLGGLGIK